MEILPHRHSRTAGKNGCGRKDGRTGRRSGKAGRTGHGYRQKHLPGKTNLRAGRQAGHTENQADKTDNFAPGTPESTPEKAADNGTEQAEESAADEDADYSDIEVEPEEDEPEEEGYVPTPEELEEELGAYYPDNNPDFATGYTFEDLKMVHKVIATDDADEQEKQQAREVLPAVMGSDVWDEMLDEFEGARQRVARLMNNSNV